jgi:hypothetical protein
VINGGLRFFAPTVQKCVVGQSKTPFRKMSKDRFREGRKPHVKHANPVSDQEWSNMQALIRDWHQKGFSRKIILMLLKEARHRVTFVNSISFDAQLILYLQS